jgi:hypothetical protein
MKLLVEIHKLSKNLPKVHDHNFVAKHAKRSGAGAHAEKSGKHAPRHRQKQQWKKEIHND